MLTQISPTSVIAVPIKIHLAASEPVPVAAAAGVAMNKTGNSHKILPPLKNIRYSLSDNAQPGVTLPGYTYLNIRLIGVAT
jgi:hypothetical protein